MKKAYFLAAGLAIGLGFAAQAQETEMPEALYLCGTPNNWTVPSAASEEELIVLSPTSEGIYEGDFYYNEDESGNPLEFKIFSAKADWDDTSAYWSDFMGPLNYVPGQTVTWYGMAMGSAGGNFIVNGWNAGEGHMKINWLSKMVELNDAEAGKAPESLHLVGDFNNWDVTDHTYELGLSVTEEDGTHYTGTFTLPEGEFKIVAGDDWTVNFGYYGNYELWSNRTTTLYMIPNANNFNCVNWKEGELIVNVDWDNQLVTFNAPDQPEYFVPEALHLVGAFNDWKVDNHDYLIPINKDVNHTQYDATFEIPEGQFEFKILASDSWDDSYGCYEGFNLWGGEYMYQTIYTEGNNIVCNNWKGGKLQVSVNWEYRQVMFLAPDQPAYEKEDLLYLVGAPQGWDIYSDAMTLQRASKDKLIYSGAFDIKEGDAMFRFYTGLGDWENGSIGSQYDDSPIDITIESDAPFAGEAVWGKGSWNIPAWEGGTLYVTVSLDSMEVEFSTTKTGIQQVVTGQPGLSYAAGVVTASEATSIVVADASGRIVMRKAGNSADLNSLPGGLYIVKAGNKAIKVMR